MCSRGVLQLQKLSLFFCDYGGSSEGVRQFLATQRLKDFMQCYKTVKFEFICKRNHHPYVSAAFLNGYIKDVPVRSESQEYIYKKYIQLTQQLGMSAPDRSGTRSYHPIKSVQGKWEPNMFNTRAEAELETTHKIPWVKVKMVEKPIVDRRFRKKLDLTNKVLQMQQMSGGYSDRNIYSKNER